MHADAPFFFLSLSLCVDRIDILCFKTPHLLLFFFLRYELLTGSISGRSSFIDMLTIYYLREGSISVLHTSYTMEISSSIILLNSIFMNKPYYGFQLFYNSNLTTQLLLLSGYRIITFCQLCRTFACYVLPTSRLCTTQHLQVVCLHNSQSSFRIFNPILSSSASGIVYNLIIALLSLLNHGWQNN